MVQLSCVDVNHMLTRLIIKVTLFQICLASLSGIYFDNGLDQTVMQHAMSTREKQHVEHEILDLLGLPHRPHRRHSPIKRSAPKFLLDVYKSLAEEASSRSTRSSELYLSGEDLQNIDESDVIMTFQSHNHHVAGVRHERGRRLWFDVSEVSSEGEGLVGAELRLYQAFNHVTDSDDEEEKYTITAYQIVKIHGERELEYISAVNTTADFEGWIELNVTAAFVNWISNPEVNRGLYLSVHAVNRPAHEIHIENIGLISSRGDDDKQPFMIGFFKANPLNSHLKQSHTLARTRNKREARRKNKADYNPGESYARNPYTDHNSYSQRSSRSCQIQTLYVNFRDLQWQDWIIAPDGYNAFYCKGECRFPLNAHMNATNHAIVQTLAHLMNPTTVPEPCCAPTKLQSMSVLYFLDDTNVILKKYKNMVVKSCGCH